MDPASSSSSVPSPLSRRAFVQAGATSAGALIIAAHVPALAADRPLGATAAGGIKPPGTRVLAPNAYVRVGADDVVTIVVSLVEMGQGTYTSIPMLIAEELDVDLSKVRIEPAPADEKTYGHPLYVLQVTGGSASIQGAWKVLRQCGATARAMLVSAAAQRWGVSPAECHTQNGAVLHKASGRRARYGELVDRAATLPVPKDVSLKNPADFKLVGTPAHRLDTPSKVDGTAQFGIDVRLPGMKVAAIANAPVIGGRLKAVNDTRARRVAGVRTVLTIDNAVVVVADHYGAAKKGLALLDITWDDGPNANFSSRLWADQVAAALKGKGQVAAEEGDFQQVMASAKRRHEAVYEAPALAHTALEPLNATVHVRQGRCDVWLGTQAQARAQKLVAEAVGLPQEKVVVHNYLLGGGFGRKLDAEYVAVAAKFAKQVPYPLKVIWSREEDIQHDAYRPYFRHELSAALDAAGAMVGFSHRLAGSAVIARYAPSWMNKGLDVDVVHTAELPYEVPARFVEYVRHEPPAGLLTGNWRGVGPTNNSYANECFIDELAALAKVDALAYRRKMLEKDSRGVAVLDLAAQKSGWGVSLGPGKGRGMAYVHAWDSRAALVMDVTVGKDGAVVVNRMVCAIDCGLVINPDGVEAQIQGGIVYGLTAALFGTLTFEGGRVVQTNFHDYQPLRIDQTPETQVHVITSFESPGGVGEMGTSLAAPAFLNALHAATGKRFRSYPVPPEQLKSI